MVLIILILLSKMENKVFLITGGASGLGASTVRAVLENGAKHVIILDKQESDDQKKEISRKYGDDKYSYHNCDVTSEEEVDRAFRNAVRDQGPIDCVVNNAGVVDDENYQLEIDINYTGVVRTTLKALEHMRKDQGGRGGTVINISSTTALEADPDFIVLPVYCATKGAVMHFTNCLASKVTWDRTGVRLMTVCYGPTQTPVVYKHTGCLNDYLEEEFRSKYHMKYTLQCSEVAVQTLIQAYKTGGPGSTWLGTNNKPPQEITAKITEAHEIMAACM